MRRMGIEARRDRWFRRLNHLAPLLGAALIAFACGTGQSTTPSSSGPIVIGDAGGQTGFMQAFDQPASDGLAIAVDEINANGGVLGGRKWQIKAIDGASDKATEFNAGVQLASENAVSIMASSDLDFGGPACSAAPNVFCSSSSGADPKFGLALGKYVFTMATTTNVEGPLAAEFAYSKGWKTAWVLTDQGLEYSKTQGLYFIQRWKELAGSASLLGSETFNNGDQSIAAQIARLRSLSTPPDVIYIASYLPGAGTAIRQIRAAGINIPIVGGIGIEGKLLNDSAGGHLSNVYGEMYGYMTTSGGSDAEPQVTKLVSEIQAKFGRPPLSSHFLTGYLFGYLLAGAINQCHCTDGAGLTKAVEGIKDYKVAGTMDTTFSPESHSPLGRSMAIYEWVGGQTQFVTRVKVQKIEPPQA
jgi:branched-chain amino acid transport system substrate-binding protein